MKNRLWPMNFIWYFKYIYFNWQSSSDLISSNSCFRIFFFFGMFAKSVKYRYIFNCKLFRSRFEKWLILDQFIHFYLYLIVWTKFSSYLHLISRNFCVNRLQKFKLVLIVQWNAKVIGFHSTCFLFGHETRTRVHGHQMSVRKMWLSKIEK